MPEVIIAEGAKRFVINGSGIRVETKYEISKGVFVAPPTLGVRAEDLESRTSSHLEYAAILKMGGQANFAIEVHDSNGGQALAVQAWNALWMFGFLSIACRVPCISLFGFSDGENGQYSLLAPNFLVIPQGVMRTISAAEVEWLRRNGDRYGSLIKNDQFSTALRAHTNAHYLFRLDQRLMLIWSGIEGLLSADHELRYRLALYSSLLVGGSPKERSVHFDRVKRAYDFRSRVIHGAKYEPSKLGDEYAFASKLLLGLLARCVELGRVPQGKEFDGAAVSGMIN